MYAAVVRQFDRPPRYETFADPTPRGPHEVVVEVLAAGLHPRVRAQANGSHYTSTDALPLIPGIDGVGRCEDGSLLYFVQPDTIYGSLAERTVVDLRRSIALPADVDPVALAAAMNPGMSSWVALHRRIALRPGQSVLVLGATGSAGRLAIPVAKHLGAGRVIAVGRDERALAACRDLGADQLVSLAGPAAAVVADLGAAGAAVDVVLDYLWGAPAEQAMAPLVARRDDPAKPLAWIAIGSVAGADIALPAALLRQANLQVMGSGQGSVSAAGFVGVLPDLARAIADGTLRVAALAKPLAEVGSLWGTPLGPERVVLVPAH